MEQPSADATGPEYYLEWRKTIQRSMHVPSIKCRSAGAILGQDYWIYGGKGPDQYSDIWRFSSQKLEWEHVVIRGSENPPPRDGHSFTKISETKFIIFGGQGNLLDTGVTERGTENGKVKCLSMRKLHDDMYEFDCETLSWTFMPRRKVRPLARRGHVMVYLKPGTKYRGCIPQTEGDLPSTGLGHLLLYGGSCLDLSTGFEKATCDVWLYSLDTHTWEEIPCEGSIPHPMHGHCAALTEDSLVVLGGIVVPKRELGMARGDKAKAQKKKRGEDSPISWPAGGMSASELELLGNNTVSVLNLATFCWATVHVDNSGLPPGFSGIGLNLVGHSVVPSPINKEEIYIFGGRRNDEKSAGAVSKQERVPANLLSLNMTTMKLSAVPLANPHNDAKNIPEARVNQMCLSLLSRTVQLTDESTEERPTARKGKAARRAPVIPEKRPQLVPHPVLRVYGGSKLYSPGFCTGAMYDLYFVPVEKRDLVSRMDTSSFRTDEDNQSSQDRRVVPPRRMSSMEIEIAAQKESRSGDVFHMLNLKPDSQMRLLSPTRGVSGQYFQLKTSLSRSRSTFARPGTAQSASPRLPEVHSSSNRPISAPVAISLPMNSLDNSVGDSGGGDQDTMNGGTSAASSQTVGLSKRALARMERERYRQMGMVLSPVTRGMTYVDARDVFNRLYPTPVGTASSRIRSFSPSATI